ncbi:Mevalonyl-coenzyme A hydratase sidH [Cladobotryum mycophilum]|uniref:Mevalonyl-coenzyme A hydratase sidH n=1 Tax=Cladobotryum mycophilum TaxID=491253 RepID=A0ABR0SEF6_9HYPO
MPPDTDQSILHSPSPEGITIITLNRPHVKNAINHSSSLQLAHAFHAFEADPSQKVCILTGTGTTFCAGYDLQEAQRRRARSHGSLQDGLHKARHRRRFRARRRGGLELSLLADIRIADTTAVFGVFCRRFGVPLIDGGTVRLQKVIGLGRAMDMILTGRPVDAQEALSMGLANRVVERGTALEAAVEMARGLLRFPQRCMRADLASAHYSAYDASSLEDALRYEFENGSRVVNEEGIAGARRFKGGQGRGGSFKLSKL